MRWIWKTGDWSCSAMACLEKNEARKPGRCGLHPALCSRPSGPRRRGEPSGVQQRDQAALLVERDQVVAAADPRAADEDLRHRPAAGLGDHRRPLTGVEVDTDLLDGIDAALL